MIGPLNYASLKKRADGFRGRWNTLHSKRPRLLYHYTDAAGLLGMLKTQRVWATNTRFLNDPTEGEYAATLVREIAAAQESHYSSSLFNTVCRGMEKILDHFEKDNDEYITCFCEKGDLLSQWRGYGAVGGGYALGFAAEHVGLADSQNAIHPEPVLRKVLYNQKQQRDLVGIFLRLMFDWEKVRRQNRRQIKRADYDDNYWSVFGWFIGESLLCFKDPAYEEEHEWRLVQYGRNALRRKPIKTEFRASRGGILEFAELGFTIMKGKYKGKLPVNSIRYGPTLDPKVTDRSLRLLCKEKGYTFVRIERSGVPFSG